jgi:hypothetical protein
VFLFIFIKSQRRSGKFLKTLSGSSPVFAYSFHTTFSQTEIGAYKSRSDMQAGQRLLFTDL